LNEGCLATRGPSCVGMTGPIPFPQCANELPSPRIGRGVGGEGERLAVRHLRKVAFGKEPPPQPSPFAKEEGDVRCLFLSKMGLTARQRLGIVSVYCIHVQTKAEGVPLVARRSAPAAPCVPITA
jgi:hypothetical protein